MLKLRRFRLPAFFLLYCRSQTLDIFYHSNKWRQTQSVVRLRALYLINRLLLWTVVSVYWKIAHSLGCCLLVWTLYLLVACYQEAVNSSHPNISFLAIIATLRVPRTINLRLFHLGNERSSISVSSGVDRRHCRHHCRGRRHRGCQWQQRRRWEKSFIFHPLGHYELETVEGWLCIVFLYLTKTAARCLIEPLDRTAVDQTIIVWNSMANDSQLLLPDCVCCDRDGTTVI